MTFDTRHLTAFLAVVAHGTLGRAAEALHVTQPALSRTIKRLEAQVGAPLFERRTTGMALTACGKALHPHAELLQREAEHATEEINALRGLAKGTIKVGAVASVMGLVLPLAVQRVLAKWPNLRVQIVEGVWDRLADALLRHEIDLALGAVVPSTDEIAAVAGCAWHDSTCVVASPAHPLWGKRRLQLRDTLDYPWASAPRGTAPFEQMRDMLGAQGLGLPNIVVETRSIVGLKSLVSHAGFLAWMAEPMYEAERAANMIGALPIPGAVAQRSLTAFRRRKGILPAPAVKLLEELRRITATIK